MGIFRVIKNRHKVLGLNARYLDYIRPYNRKGAIKIADDKLLTKSILKKAELDTPDLLGKISDERELEEFDFEQLPRSFVIKPVHGIEGGGIEIFYNYKDEHWIKADKSRVSHNELKNKVREILQGRYSLHNQPDKVMIEERVKPHKAFRYYTYQGTPDIRVVVFNGVPIMGMVRLATQDSQGRANLQLGAIGGAVDVAAGRVMTAVKGKFGEIEYVPHTNLRISGLRIPYWNKMLRLAIKAQQATNLGFASVDFLLDREKGPLVVELNARTGLSIQLADQEGMRTRLERVKGIKVSTLEQGIRLGKDMFGGEIQESIENISGKQVIGLIEDVTIYGPNGDKIEIKAKIDTGADSTSIDRNTLKKVGYGEILQQYDNFMKKYFNPDRGLDSDRQTASEYADELTEKIRLEDIGVEKIVAVNSSHGRSFRPYIRIKLKLKETTFETLVSAYDRQKLTYACIIGRKSLNNFLIDSGK